MSLDALSTEDQKRLREIVDQGVKVTQELQDLRDGLKDTVKAVADELNITPGDLKEAIRLAFNGKIADKKESMSVVEEILHVTGRT
jgi:hypothetical protein